MSGFGLLLDSLFNIPDSSQKSLEEHGKLWSPVAHADTVPELRRIELATTGRSR